MAESSNCELLLQQLPCLVAKHSNDDDDDDDDDDDSQ